MTSRMAARAEEWRPVLGWADYEASSVGRIRRKAGSYHCPRGRVLKAFANKKGYGMVRLCQIGRRDWTVSVHRLVAEAWYGPRPDGLTINHRDGDKRNNTPANLEYATNAENMAHAARYGLRPVGGLVRNGKRQFTDVQVLEIRERWALGDGASAIARSLGLPRPTVDAITACRNWKHGPFPTGRREARGARAALRGEHVA